MAFIRRFFQRFMAQTRGNVMIIVGATLPVIALAAGGGIDYANIVNARARLQDAADSAAIAAALNSAGDLSSQQAAAKKAFDANLVGEDLVKTGKGVLSVKTVGSVQTMHYVATATVTTFMPRLVNRETLDISATADAGVSINKAEIVFVLDNTGSMADKIKNGTTTDTVTKMAALKSSLDATLASLLDEKGGNPGGTKVALVPFDTQVALDNVAGMTGYATGFVSVSTYSCTGSVADALCGSMAADLNTTCQRMAASDQSACLTNARIYTRTNNNKYYVFAASYVPVYTTNRWGDTSLWYYKVVYSQATYSSTGVLQSGTTSGSTDTSYSAYPYSVPNNYSRYTGNVTYGVPTGGGYNSGSAVIYKDNATITANSDLMGVGTLNWSGCVIDRVQPYDTTSDKVNTAVTNTLYPAAKCATATLLPIMDMTTDIAKARTYAAKMTPAGNTNVTIGIQWGMEVLSPEAPFTQGAAFHDPVINKYMIVLTDGLNTQNRWSTKASDINLRTALACENAKKLGITVFTVRLADGDSSMLSTCASNSNYYYNLTSSTQLNGTLGSIMKSIKKVRLTQ